MYISYRIDRKEGDPIFVGPMEARQTQPGSIMAQARKLGGRIRTRLSRHKDAPIHSDAIAARASRLPTFELP